MRSFSSCHLNCHQAESYAFTRDVLSWVADHASTVDYGNELVKFQFHLDQASPFTSMGKKHKEHNFLRSTSHSLALWHMVVAHVSLLSLCTVYVPWFSLVSPPILPVIQSVIGWLRSEIPFLPFPGPILDDLTPVSLVPLSQLAKSRKPGLLGWCSHCRLITLSTPKTLASPVQWMELSELRLVPSHCRSLNLELE